MIKPLAVRATLLIMAALWIFTATGCASGKMAARSNAIEEENNGGSESQRNYNIFAKGIPSCDGITIDLFGNMYVGSRSENCLYKISPDGQISRFADIPCRELLCLTTDSDGNIYAAGRDTLSKVSPSGEGRILLDGFNCADDLRIDPQGVIYLVDASDNIVYRITPDLKKTVFISSDLALEKLKKWEITGITFDPSYQYLYIARMRRGRIEKYPILSDGTAGEPKVIAKGLPGCDHLEMDQQGNLYVTLYSSGSLLRIDPDMRRKMIIDGQFSKPTGIAFGKKGFNEYAVYIADYQADQIYEVSVDIKGI